MSKNSLHTEVTENHSHISKIRASLWTHNSLNKREDDTLEGAPCASSKMCTANPFPILPKGI